MTSRRLLTGLCASALAGAPLGCGDDDSATGSGGTDATSGAGASSSALGSSGQGGGLANGSWELDYDAAFPQDRVLELRIEISASDWQVMLDDMTELAGEFGSGGMGGPPGGVGVGGGLPGFGGGFPGIGGGPPQGFGGAPPGFGGGLPVGVGVGAGGGIPGGGGDFLARDPVYVPSRLIVGDATWENVGVRFKGNSSLSSAWSGGIYKIPLRLKLDEFEDTRPEVADQRFFGFQSISLANGWSDPSLVREKIGSEVFVAAGVRAPATAFYAVTIDHGSGPEYFGLYTAGELPDDDPFLEGSFGSDDLNVYKPEGGAATWASWNEEELDKKTNKDGADFSDAQALYDALHADRSDAEAWRAGLEEAFDVDGFLAYLATNTAIEDWDQYGNMSHNYYLVRDGELEGPLVWVPWDHTFVFPSDGGMQAMGQALSLSLDEVGDGWPLIRYLMDDETYRETYRQKLAAVVVGPIDPDELSSRIEAAHALIAPWVVGPNGEREGFTFTTDAEFESSPSQLSDYLTQRKSEIEDFLAND